nr:bone morphogenetic protein 3 [Sinonovacula constricta]
MELKLKTYVCVCVLLVWSAVNAGNTEVDGVKMHNFVKSMLGFTGEVRNEKKLTGEAPKFMLDLYERFKDGPISKGQMSSNTIRSIQPKIMEVHGEQMYVFNLSSMTSTEQMISAEIHFYKRRKTRFNEKADLELILHQITPLTVTLSGAIKIQKGSFGWQWHDITDDVTKCLNNDQHKPYSLGLNFESLSSNGKANLIKLKRFTYRHSLPYLIIYSNDSQDLDIEDIDQNTVKIDHEIPLTDNNVDSRTKLSKLIPVRSKREKRSLDDNSADLPAYSRARSMSILTNEIPENPDDYRAYPINVNIATHPGMLQTRKESRHKLGDSRLIPLPGEFVAKRKNKKQKQKKKNRKQNKLELPRDWEKLHNMGDTGNKGSLCGRRKLTVDFNEIGWGEWIISPKSFKAHYCAGSCPFPLTKKLRPSNHATIQSLVNAVGINPEVPAPCCVPDRLSSLTLLYFDENGNVVLKNYPDMTVKRCACR